jgi:diguanylate cyclase (GGDEF)-like protein
LAVHAAIAFDNAKLFRQLQQLAITDSLTNVSNRCYFFYLAQREFRRSDRYHYPLSVMILDIDHYKIKDDTYGHVIGDVALKVISQHLMENIRETDILGRYEGDEFSILLPETELGKANEIAGRLRVIIHKNPFRIAQNEITLTISVGVSCSNESITELLICS